MSLESRLLTALTPWLAAPGWRVAFSGGLDSSVLLHLLVRLSRRQALPAISAIHVHHGLQAVADAWPDHCQRICAALGVPLQVCRVQVPPGASLERAAREARYNAFAEALQEGELLLIAQHRDDQAETLLLRLLRGAGVRGLTAMPTQRGLGRGWLLRPLLDCSRAELEAYAREHRLEWIDDPSNQDNGFARNHLRNQVLPLLRQHWPQASGNLARCAGHLNEAQGLLDELAHEDLTAAGGPSAFAWLSCPSLALAPLRALSPARQRNALRHWLAAFTPLPDSEHWAGWESMRDAAVDAAPIWRLARGELRRGAGRIWWLAGEWLDSPAGETPWPDLRQALSLAGNGRVRLSGESLPPGPLQVRYRRAGEVLNVHGRGHRDLKRLLNETALPAFVRGRLPLLCRADEVLAVANLPELDAAPGADWRFCWDPPA